MSDPTRNVQDMNYSREEIAVTTNEDGVPLIIHRQGRAWVVGAEPMRWYERTKWWQEAQRMPRGEGRMDVQVWRVQARLGRNTRSDLVTMDLEKGHGDGPWRVRMGGVGA